MSSMTVEREVAATPEKVWAIITDLDRSAEVISGITSLERLDDGSDFSVGTTWSETRVMFRKESTETMAVTAVDEGHSYTVEADANGAHYTAVMTVEPKGEGSRLSMTFGAEATSTAAKVMSIFGKLFEGSTRKMLAQDLDDIAAAAEQGDG